jgi:hypothetical protein
LFNLIFADRGTFRQFQRPKRFAQNPTKIAETPMESGTIAQHKSQQFRAGLETSKSVKSPGQSRNRLRG